MSVTIQNRNIGDLHKVAREACKLFLAECERAGVKIFITETHRSQARQNYLYASGRTRPGDVVTKTLNSNHKSGLAWDIAVSPPLTLYDASTMNKAGAIARKLGITWGGDWKGFVDRPHFEVKVNWKAPAGNVAHVAPVKPKEDEELKFSSPTLKAETETSLLSKAHRQIVVDAAVKAGAHASWADKLENGTLKDADVLGLAVKYTVAVNK